MTAARGIRNNNPGNLRHGQPWQGLAPQQTDSAFATFTSMPYGIRALVITLQTYMRKHGLRTVRGIIGRWAPPSENDTGAYIRAVCAPAGLAPDQELSDERLTYEYLARQIARHENGPAEAAKITEADWRAGLDLVFGQASRGGTPAPAEQVVTIVEPAAPAPAGSPAEPAPPKPRNLMALPALALAALPTLIENIPALIRVFGKGERSKENAETAQKVVDVVKTATASSSIEEAIGKVTGDPAARAAANSAVESAFYQLTEAGGGGLQGAREFNLEAARDGTPFWLMPAFWVSMSLLPLLYGTVYVVLTTAGGEFSGELKAAIASSVVTGILGAVVGFWLGSSFTTSRSRGLGATPTQS
jgi:hypothetical protein